MKVLFTCGGTAGHINPAIAIAQRLSEFKPDTQYLFVGAGRELENRLIPAAGYEIENVHMTGISRSISFSGLKHNIETIRNIITSFKKAKKIIKEFSPDIVVGTGGYVCYPVIKAAHSLRIPTMIHESNAVPGLTTRMLEGTVDKIMTAFPDTGKYYRKSKKITVTGTPIRSDFLKQNRPDAKDTLGIGNAPLVVAFWGSLGADKMNEYMEEFVSLAGAAGLFKLIYGIGTETRLKSFREKVPECESEWVDVRPYISDMGTVMNAADLILCRSGASTLAELTGIGRASILIPSPNVTNNHQMKNALELEKAGAAIVREESALSGRELFDLAKTVVSDRMKLVKMERAAAAMGTPDSAGKIAALIIWLTDNNKKAKK